MCTYAFHFDPKSVWPFVIAGNRDEMLDRPWQAPAEHWADRPGVIGGLDDEAGGTWAGMNAHGVVAVLLNRWDTLGPAPDKRSRGEIVLDALDFADAAEAVEALAELSPDAYKGFNLILADNRDCFWLSLTDEHGVRADRVEQGTHLITHGDLDDITSRRIERFLPQFEFLGDPASPESAAGWSAWRDLLNDTSQDPANDHKSALFVRLPAVNFGTGSQSFMALRRAEDFSAEVGPGVYWFAKAGEAMERIVLGNRL